MRVLHVAQPTTGGVPRVVLSYAADQLCQGHDIVVACPDGPLAKAVRRAGLAHLPWSAARRPGPGVLEEVRALRNLVEDARPDVVHLHSAKAGLAGRLAVRGRVPTVFQPHAWSFEAVRGGMRRAALRWERHATRWTGLVLCVSEAESRLGRRSGVAGEHRVVRNGVDLGRFSPIAREAARPGLGVDAATPLAVCVGRLCEQKGQDRLIAAWPGIRAEVPGAELVLVGDGPDRTRLETLAGPGIRFAGAVADPRPWYAAADVVAVPSRWEGMALVPLEAQAMARSVVAFEVAGMAESVPREAGRVVPAGDTGAFAAALARRLRDRELTLAEGRLGARYALLAHDATAAARNVTGLYAELLKRCGVDA
ncbi:glycosyltransferase [Amycolatopsis anabasis]|uniref:glycosyltransferase n=1 Tax=Amycolatopsis anabasis TaxID=1840409 RepID=UPI00131D5706|nr:glycosyltransferase [Amycolatopsis anabasis]